MKIPNELTWWQKGPIYQIYPISFYDSNNDGMGDLAGIIEKLKYIKDLGVAAIWLSPVYPSPMKDFGYDVSDYCNIDSRFGDLGTFKKLMEACTKLDIKVIMDLVINHTSDQHPWFLESSSSRENPKRDWYIWHDAKPNGSPPNNWPSLFGGSGWEWHEPTQQYFLHKFLKEQPDLNLWNPAVMNAILKAMEFWLKLGVAGFRMDVNDLYLEDPTFADAPVNPNYVEGKDHSANSVFWTQAYWRPETHEIMRKFRSLLNTYEAVGIGEVNSWHMIDFYGNAHDELQLPFNFSLLHIPWNAASLRKTIGAYQQSIPEGCWPNYVLGNHDTSRLGSRIGTENLRVATMLLMTLPGTPFIYYGEEIGMIDMPVNQLKVQDTPSLHFAHEDSRDPERTPMQWNAGAYGGFSTIEPWLSPHTTYSYINAETQTKNKQSLLWLYRELIRLRKNSLALSSGDYESLYVIPETVFAYRRYCGNEQYVVLLNCSDTPVTVNIGEYYFSGRCVFSTHPISPFTIHGDLKTVCLRANEGKIFKIY